MGRKPIGDRAMTDAERQRRRRAKLAPQAPPATADAAAAQAAVSNATPAELARLKDENARLKAENARLDKRIGKDGKARRLPKRLAPVSANPVQQINNFHRELLGFLTDFTARFIAWHDAKPLIDEQGKATLMQAMYLVADGFAHLSQKLDGR